MEIGFSGTQGSLTSTQEFILEKTLKELRRQGYLVLHHGDCIGADSIAHRIWRRLDGQVVLHPPEFNTKRAFCDYNEIRPSRAYLHRNHDIVDESSFLIACPSTHVENELLRSGTWATIRYARRTGHPIIIIDQDGRMKQEKPS